MLTRVGGYADPLGLGLSSDRRVPDAAPAPEPAGPHRLTLAQVRQIIREQTLCDSSEFLGDMFDAALVRMLDDSIDYKIYVVGREIMTREEMCQRYAFLEFGTTPEQVCEQQCIYEFADGRTIAAGPALVSPDLPTSTRATRVYIGRQGWEDFQQLTAVCRGLASARPESVHLLLGSAPPAGAQPSTGAQPSAAEGYLEEFRTLQARVRELEKRLELLEGRLS